jgi:hypothetical protein
MNHKNLLDSFYLFHNPSSQNLINYPNSFQAGIDKRLDLGRNHNRMMTPMLHAGVPSFEINSSVGVFE